MARIYVGTCSWSQHTDFYPPDLPANEQLAFYAQHFPVVELDATFYRMMRERNFQLWAERTPEGFLFDVKPYKQLTWHDRDAPPTDEVAVAFRDALRPLREVDKLSSVHFQFPPWYRYTPENLDYILHVRDTFAQDRVAVEFRHRSWLEGDHLPKLFETLREHDVSLTVVDEPQLGTGSVPTVLTVTDPDLVIVRFHGRNYKKWYAKVENTAERFDYLYSEQELSEWVPNVGQLAENAREVHVLFNNNAANYAVVNGRQMQQLLLSGLPGSEIVPPPGAKEPVEEQ